MNTHQALNESLKMGELVSMMYLKDLTDEEMFHRPANGANHVNWQFGHLIAAENHFMNIVAPGESPDLPDGFKEMYSKETATSDDPASFANKEVLFAAYRRQREATLKILDSMSVDDFDKETGIDYIPTYGALFSMQGSHYLMHAGQWAVVRRQLGRAPLI